jgi:tripeptidyl-peptidase-2
MILTYTFEQDEKGSFTPRAPALQGVLYEAAFESQCMIAFDGEKKYLGMSDAYPSNISAAKGTVIIRLQIRHSDPSQLEKYKDLVIWIERTLSKEIPLSVYGTKENMLMGKNPFNKHSIKMGASMPVFFSEPEHSQLPVKYASGHQFLGTVSFGANDESLPGAGKRPNGYPIWYVLAFSYSVLPFS